MDDKKLYEMGENLFSKRSSLVNYWQDVAENFYPERANFTGGTVTADGSFASNLATSYPIMARRDLGSAFSSMLRPTQKEWFKMTIRDKDRLDSEAKLWLEWATKLQRRAMYDRSSKFSRATKEGDHDFACFGQTVISVQPNRNADGLLYRCWHLRDVAWNENESGDICSVFRRWKPTVYDLVRLFPADSLSPDTVKRLNHEPYEECNIMHMVVESSISDYGFKTPFTSIFYDPDHNKTLEKVGLYSPMYIVPRWETVSGSQYAYSPAVVAALPDARLLQSMTATLLEAGEKMTNPPMIAVEEAIRSDVSIYAGAITWVDAAYDERLGEVLRPLTQDKSGMPLGIDMQRDTRAMLSEAFYLNKLSMPNRAPEMTAYEVGQRIQQYIRDALPLFEPMESEYNGALCEETANIMLRAGAFGSMLDMPKSLRGQDIEFVFESPLHDAVEREKGNRFFEAQQFTGSALQLDPSAGALVDVHEALRDVLEGIGVPAKWVRDEKDVQEMLKAQQAQQQNNQLMDNLSKGADIASTLGDANQKFNATQGVM
jgi:hypothetical protein